MARENARPSKPQLALLAELVETGRLYIKRTGRYGRTVDALGRRGLARVDEPDHSVNAQDGWVPTDEGRALIAQGDQ
jgi:hypothetical protein